MFFKTSVAAFFVGRESKNWSLGQLVTLLLMKNQQTLGHDEKLGLGIHDPTIEAVYGEWGPFGDAWTRLDKLERHYCLQVYFSMNHFLDLLPENSDYEDLPLSQDPLLPLVETFGNACERIKAEVAFLDTNSHYGNETWENKQGNRDWVISHYSMIEESNINGLANEAFGLLYLNKYMDELWDSKSAHNDRDIIPLSQGCLTFAGLGSTRWS